jgi:hypothetical protein
LAAVASTKKILGREDEQPIFDDVVPAFFEFAWRHWLGLLLENRFPLRD